MIVKPNTLKNLFTSVGHVRHASYKPCDETITNVFKKILSEEKCQSWKSLFFRGALPDSTTGKIIQTVLETFPNNIPELAWKDEFHEGGTGYIDGVKPEDMSHPVMCGIDPSKRPFVAIRTVQKCDDGKYDLNQKSATVIFQRYIGNSNTWAAGCHYYPNALFAGPLNKEDLRNFTLLIKGEEVSYRLMDHTNIRTKIA